MCCKATFSIQMLGSCQCEMWLWLQGPVSNARPYILVRGRGGFWLDTRSGEGTGGEMYSCKCFFMMCDADAKKVALIFLQELCHKNKLFIFALLGLITSLYVCHSII